MHITKPTLLVDEKKCRKNIESMARKASTNNLLFKPHFKTAQSHKIGQWYREAGVEAITVSSLGMAAYFAEDGWEDITVAFPANILQMEEINQLAASIKLTLLVDNEQAIQALEQGLTSTLSIYIELDSGKGRTGVNISNTEQIEQLVKQLESTHHLYFKGFYLHAGHSYECKGEDEIRAIYEQAQPALKTLRSLYGHVEICYGDTPTCSVIDHFENIDALSLGNFVFFDVMQVQIGACQFDDIAVAVACPVVSVNPQQNQVGVYGGGIHFSKDFIIDNNGNRSYGQIVVLNDTGWSAPIEGCYMKSLSQEHGIVTLSNEIMNKIKIGDILGVLPIHSCMTAECMGEYYTLQGEYADHYSQKNRA